ncbi:MAG: glycosyltransferase family 39 protein [Vicingaceae bacterium]
MSTVNSLHIFLIALIARLIAMYFNDAVAGDSVARVLITLDWLENPHVILSGVWAPFHFYLIAPVIWIFNDHIVAPVFINVLLGSFTVVLVYKISEKLYDHPSAILASLIFCFIPNVFRQHMMVMAGTPMVLFMAWSIYYLILSVKSSTEGWKYGLVAGLLYTLASGFRFETWILMPCFALILIVLQKWKTLFAFVSMGVLFPISWLLTSYVDTGDFLYSIHQSAEWNIKYGGVNDDVTEPLRYARIYFQPVLLLLNLTPVLFLWFVFNYSSGLVKAKITLQQAIWLAPFIYLIAIFQYKIYTGDVNLHPRYAYTLFFLLSPHLAVLYSRKFKWLQLVALSLILYGFFSSFQSYRPKNKDSFKFHAKSQDGISLLRQYIFSSQSAVPLLKDQKIKDVSTHIKNNLKTGDGLILDFIAWDKAGYIRLHSGLQRKDLLEVILTHMNYGYEARWLKEFLDARNQGMIFLQKGSKFESEYVRIAGDEMLIDREFTLLISDKYELDPYVVYRYRYKPR